MSICKQTKVESAVYGLEVKNRQRCVKTDKILGRNEYVIEFELIILSAVKIGKFYSQSILTL